LGDAWSSSVLGSAAKKKLAGRRNVPESVRPRGDSSVTFMVVTPTAHHFCHEVNTVIVKGKKGKKRHFLLLQFREEHLKSPR